MTAPNGKDRHGFVAVTEPALAHPQRIQGVTDGKGSVEVTTLSLPQQTLASASVLSSANQLSMGREEERDAPAAHPHR